MTIVRVCVRSSGFIVVRSVTTVARTVGSAAFVAAGCGGAGLHATQIAIRASNATREIANP